MFQMNDMALTVLIWVGVAAIAALVWLVVEAALTVRSARSTITELSERVEPTLAHVEQITESLKPAIDRLDPLMERASLTVDTVNLELMQIDKILSDTSNITGTASGAVQKISDVANAPANLASGAVDKLRSLFGQKTKETRVQNACKANDTAALGAVTSNEQTARSSKLVDEWSQVANKASKISEADKTQKADKKQDSTISQTKSEQTKKDSSIDYAVVNIGNTDLDIDEPTSGLKDGASSARKGEKNYPSVESSQSAQQTQSTAAVAPSATQTQPAQAAPQAQPNNAAQTKEDRIKEIDEMLDNSSFFK